MAPSETSPGALARGLESAWMALGYVVGGVVMWGGLGYWLDGVLGWRPALTILGALVGNAAGIYLIYLRWPTEQEGRRAA